MAGFMSGFGSAFANSFNQAADARAKREDDLFRIKYQQRVEKASEYKKKKEEDKKNVEGAKQLARQYTGSEETWGEIYKMKTGGQTDALIIDFLKENQPEITPGVPTDNSGPAAPGSDISSSAASSVDAQMAESGLETPEDGGLFKGARNLGKEIFSSEAQNERMTGRVDSRLDEAMGPEESYDPGETLAGAPNMTIKWKPKSGNGDLYKSNSLPEAAVARVKAQRSGDPEAIAIAQEVYDSLLATEEVETYMQAKSKADAEGRLFKPTMAAVKQSDGSYTYAQKTKDGWIDTTTNALLKDGDVEVMDADAMEFLTEIRKSIGPEGVKYGEQAGNFVTTVRDIEQMASIIEKNPTVMSLAGWAAKTGDNMIRDAMGIVDLLKAEAVEEKFSNSSLSKLGDYEAELEKKYQDYVPKTQQEKFEQLALARSLIEIKAVKAAYASAASVGQTGQGVAAREFDRFYNSIMNPNPEAWMEEASNFVLGQYDSFKRQGKTLNEKSPVMSEFELRFGFPAPLKVAPDVDVLLSEDKLATRGLERFSTLSQRLDPNVSNPDQMNTSPEGYEPAGKSPEGKVLYKKIGDTSGKVYEAD